MAPSSIPSIFDLTNRGVVVTGGGGHLGSTMALGLAEAGAKVVICGRRQEQLDAVVAHARLAELRGAVHAVVADVATDSGLASVLDHVEHVAGRCHGFVNNAYAGSGGRLLDVERSTVDTTIRSALTDTIIATRFSALRMKASGGGSIVNVASMYGLVAPQPAVYDAHPEWHNPPAYGAAKAGVIQFSRYAAVDLAEHGIRVNSISPGAFPGGRAGETEGFVAELLRRIPLRRIGKPSDLVGAVVYLISDASSYVTGHDLVVDGGWTSW